MTSEEKDYRYGPVVAKIGSRNDPDKTYEIRCLNGGLSCNCQGWRFRKTCRHTGFVEDRPELWLYEKTDPLEKAIADILDGAVSRQLVILRCKTAQLVKAIADAVRGVANVKTSTQAQTAGKVRMIYLED